MATLRKRLQMRKTAGFIDEYLSAPDKLGFHSIRSLQACFDWPASSEVSGFVIAVSKRQTLKART